MSASVADDPVLRRFRKELDRAYGNRIERVVLFGSRARGDHREDSDYDIAVFLHGLDDWWTEIRRIVDISYDTLGDAAPLISAKPLPAEAYGDRTGFMREVRRDGIEL